jgi:hypothetical protein
MSDQTPAAVEAAEPEAPEAAAEATPETPVEETPAAEETIDVAALRREAASHRVKARDALAERDALAARVETYQRREVERLASAQLAQGSDVFLDVELAAFLDDEGEVSADLVTAAATAAAAKRPGLAAPRPSFDGGVRGPATHPSGPSFAEGFRKAARR